jgi:hypothetical protein
MPLDKNQILVGKPLPFSIFGADNKLLLAEGQVVSSEGMRDALARNGRHTRAKNGSTSGNERTATVTGSPRGSEPHQPYTETPLDRFAREHSALAGRGRPSLSMAREEAGDSYSTRILTVHDNNSLILSAPVRTDGTWVSVLEGTSWTFRTLYYTMALRFQATVLKTVFDPFPHLHVEVPHHVERRKIRKAARVVVSLPATIVALRTVPAVIIDVSLGGARLALDAEMALELRQVVMCAVSLPIGDRVYSLDLRCTVIAYEPGQAEHSHVGLYRVQFELLEDISLLAMHAYINSVLATDVDSFSRLIAFEPIPAKA